MDCYDSIWQVVMMRSFFVCLFCFLLSEHVWRSPRDLVTPCYLSYPPVFFEWSLFGQWEANGTFVTRPGEEAEEHV